MGELGAFLKIHRVGFDKRDPEQRVHDYKQYFVLQPESELRKQGARCMDCGIPFCHEGCPLGNLIPDWNDLVYRGKWREAIDQLHATNNFPEFTGRICPAPCESACVLAINDDPVTIEQIELAIAERPPGKTIVAGTGTNDTRHAVFLTERASELGADAMISVTPYYNRPSPLGLKRHYEAVAAATDKPILLYNIPSRTGTNMGPDLLTELAQIGGIEGVKQANPNELQLIDGLALYAGDDSSFAHTLDIGGAGGIAVASHIVGNEMRRMVDEPEHRAEIDASLQDVYETLFLTSSPTCTKAALNLLGHNVGGLRLPLVEATPEETEAVRAMLERHGLVPVLPAPTPA